MADLVTDLRSALVEVAVPDDVEPMQRYLKDRFPFLGVKSVARRTATKELVRPLRGDRAAIVELVDALWDEPERELHQVAVDLLDANWRVLADGDLEWLAGLVTTNAWWDSVDALAYKVIGPAALRRPAWWEELDSWNDAAATEPEMWLVRTSIIQQLGYRDETNEAVLFDRCRRRATDREFFIAKAIGWALRTHGRRRPDAVRAFVDEYRDRLRPLSVREATKHL